MLIHIEWVDLCWKTTLIDKIELLFKNVVVFKTPKNLLPRKNSLKERERIWNYYIETLEWIIQDFEKDPNQIYVLDRFFFSELVYWKVMRGYDSEDMKPCCSISAIFSLASFAPLSASSMYCLRASIIEVMIGKPYL